MTEPRPELDREPDGRTEDPLPRLWESDSGTLRAPSRRALVRLVQGPLLAADRHPILWGALLNDEDAIRSRLADLFLDLVIDTSAQVAFIRNVNDDALDAPKVVRTQALTFIDTALLLHLRQLLLQSDGAGRTIVGQDEAVDQLAVYRAHDNADPAGFTKRINASWTKFTNSGLLARTSTEGRFEVSPVLRLIFGPDQIAAVQAEYGKLASKGSATLFALNESESE